MCRRLYHILCRPPTRCSFADLRLAIVLPRDMRTLARWLAPWRTVCRLADSESPTRSKQTLYREDRCPRLFSDNFDTVISKFDVPDTMSDHGLTEVTACNTSMLSQLVLRSLETPQSAVRALELGGDVWVPRIVNWSNWSRQAGPGSPSVDPLN